MILRTEKSLNLLDCKLKHESVTKMMIEAQLRGFFLRKIFLFNCLQQDLTKCQN